MSSPPDDTAKKLDNLSATTGTIVDAFNSILKIPYVEGLQVDDTGKVSVEDEVKELREKYQTLQANTLPFARDLYAYAGIQVQTIPLIGESLPLETYLKIHKSIIARKKLEATEVKEMSETFRKEFEVTLSVFESAIESLGEQIDDLSSSIRSTKDAHEKAKASAIISGVLAGLFTAAAIFGMVATAGALAGAAGSSASGFAAVFGASLQAASGMSGLIGVTAALSTGALASLTTTIITSIEAGNYQRAISAMQSLKASTTTTRDQLSEVVKKMENIEDSLDGIVTVWTDVESSLLIIESDIAHWEQNFSQSVAASTIKEWQDVQGAVQKYTTIVSGERSLKSGAGQDEVLTVERLMIGTRAMAVSELKAGLDAPEVDFHGKLSDLYVAKQGLKTARGVSQGRKKLSSQINSAEKYLVDTEKGMTASAGNLRGLAQTSLKCFAELKRADDTNKLKMLVEYVNSIRTEMEKQMGAATAAEKSAFNFQTAVGIVNNMLIKIIAEKKAQQDLLRKRLADVEKDRRNRKWLWIIPLAGAINELVDLANDIQGDINKLRREIASLSRIRAGMLDASKAVSHAVKDCTVIVQTFSTILNGSQVALENVNLVDALQLAIPPEILESAERSWAELDDDVTEFLS